MENCPVYMDDKIVRGKTFTEHLVNLREVFERLKVSGLKLNPVSVIFVHHRWSSLVM